MAFTADELQSFNDILERRLTAQRRDIEQLFEKQTQALRRDFEQRLLASQREMMRLVTQHLQEQQKKWQTVLQQKISSLQIALAAHQEAKDQPREPEQEPVAEVLEHALAAQLLAIEELLARQPIQASQEHNTLSLTGEEPQYEAIEVQTDLPWDDLMDIFGKVLDERLNGLAETTLAALRNWEQLVSSRLHAIQSQMHDITLQGRQAQAYSGNLTSMHEVFQSIEQLEHLIESMQVAMTTNHALLSNRLYHHQQLPLERAHPSSQVTTASVTQAHPNGTGVPHSLPGERKG